MNKTPLVSIIIVNWNGSQVFASCLTSLEKLKYPRWELIVVDNGSIDKSQNLPVSFKLNHVQYGLIQNTSNLGFAAANNQGLEKVKGEYILLLNNDTLVTPDFLNIMISKMEKDKNIGVMQPKIFLIDKPGYLDNAGTYLTWTGFLEHWGFMQKDKKEFNKDRKIFSAKGACLLTRSDLVNKIGLFDMDFGSYFEETDFCWRVWLAGYDVVYYPQSHIYHMLGATSKKMKQTTINYHSFKNRICSLTKNLNSANLVSILIPHILILLGLGAFYLVRLQIDKTLMIYKSILWNIFHLKQTLDKRNKVQKMRVKSDEEIFEKVYKKVNIHEMLLHFKRVEANFSK